jgi:hypothetical protein
MELKQKMQCLNPLEWRIFEKICAKSQIFLVILVPKKIFCFRFSNGCDVYLIQ